MTTALAPQTRTGTRITWDLGGAEVQAEQLGNHWALRRPWSLHTLRLRAEPEITVRLGEAEAVAHLVEHVAVPPGSQVGLWMSWPLVVALRCEGQVIDTFRPGMQRTVLGTVDSGRVLPAARCAIIDGPRGATSPTHAAIHVTLSNRTSAAVNLRRFPISEPALTLARSGDHLAAGMIVVTVTEPQHAEVHVTNWALPEGFVTTGRGDAPSWNHSPLKLDWFLDATRRSTEFQL